MTEQEWLTSDNPMAMLKYTLTEPKREALWTISDRKLKLLVLAILDNCLAWKNDPTWKITYPARPVLVLQGLSDWIEKGIDPPRRDWRTGTGMGRLQTGAEMTLRLSTWREGEEPSQADRAGFLRCIIGNPWRPLPYSWLDGNLYAHVPIAPDPPRKVVYPVSWITPRTRNMAQRIYDEQDWGAMPILADVLEEAGCNDEGILMHLRGKESCPVCLGKGTVLVPYDPDQRPWRTDVEMCLHCGGTDNLVKREPGSGWIALRNKHVQGCHILDLLLGKE